MNIDKLKQINPKRILDIGANIGQFNMLCKSVFPNSYIFSIEGSHECENYLKNITKNYLITLLSDEVKNVKFYKNKNNPICTGHSIYRELTHHYNDDNVVIENRKTNTLDNIFPESEMFDLIKIDTQGSEIDIINGGLNICKKSKYILMEVSLQEYNQNTLLYDDTIIFMDKIGFKKIDELEDHYHNGNLVQKDILFKNINL